MGGILHPAEIVDCRVGIAPTNKLNIQPLESGNAPPTMDGLKPNYEPRLFGLKPNYEPRLFGLKPNYEPPSP